MDKAKGGNVNHSFISPDKVKDCSCYTCVGSYYLLYYACTLWDTILCKQTTYDCSQVGEGERRRSLLSQKNQFI